MQVTIGLPDDTYNNYVLGAGADYKDTVNLPGQGNVPNPQTKEQYAQTKLVNLVRTTVIQYLGQQAAQQAATDFASANITIVATPDPVVP